jgi:hypothetical protein
LAQVYTTGAVPIWCGVGGPSALPLLLGWAEKFPRIQIRPAFSPVFCDLGGQRVPLDYMFEGEEAIITADVIRFNEGTYRIIADRAATGLGGNLGARGYSDPGEIGTLMVQEKIAYPLWLPFLYAAKALMPGMPSGYHFFRCFLEGPDELEQGTVPRKLRMLWHAVRDLDMTVSEAEGAGRLSLYDNDCSAVSGLTMT